MSFKNHNQDSISLKTLDYSIEDGNLKIINKECTEKLKKEKMQYMDDFKVSINPKKDAVFVKRGNEQTYLKIINKLLNINASMPQFKKFMKNGNISQQKTLPSFNPEKLSHYYERTKNNELLDFPEPLETDKINEIISSSETPKKLSNSFSEDFSFSDASNDLSNISETTPNNFKKEKSSPFGLNIYMTPNEHSKKTTTLNNISTTPQISLATCYDDNLSSSSANSSSSIINNSTSTNTTLYVNQPQNSHADNNNNSSSAPTPSSKTTFSYSQHMMIHVQPQDLFTKPPSSSIKHSIQPPERSKLNIQYNRKKETSSTYKIIGDEAKIQKMRSSVSKMLFLSPNANYQKIIFVS